MSMTDPVADMLTRIRNGCRAHLERVGIPNSKLKVRVAEILKKEGYIEDFRIIKDMRQGLLEVKLKYGDDHQPVARDVDVDPLEVVLPRPADADRSLAHVLRARARTSISRKASRYADTTILFTEYRAPSDWSRCMSRAVTARGRSG